MTVMTNDIGKKLCRALSLPEEVAVTDIEISYSAGCLAKITLQLTPSVAQLTAVTELLKEHQMREQIIKGKG